MDPGGVYLATSCIARKDAEEPRGRSTWEQERNVLEFFRSRTFILACCISSCALCNVVGFVYYMIVKSVPICVWWMVREGAFWCDVNLFLLFIVSGTSNIIIRRAGRQKINWLCLLSFDSYSVFDINLSGLRGKDL